MIARNGASDFERIRLDNPASGPSDAVRLDQLQQATSGVQRHGDPVSADQVDGLDAAIDAEVGNFLIDGDSIAWVQSGTKRYARIRLKAGGGLKVDADGVAVDPSGVAAANHTHDQLHNAATVASSASLSLSIAGQEISGNVVVKSGGGLSIGGDGLEADYGPSGVARSSHTHAQLHDAATVVNSNSLTLAVSGQQISGDVRLKAAGGLAIGADGLRVDLGPSGTQAAAGNHTHGEATSSAPGFLSAADKRKIDMSAALLNADQVVGFKRSGAFAQGEYVGGRVRWGQSMLIVAADVAAKTAPISESVLGIEVDGSVADTLIVPPSAGESLNGKALSPELAVEADKYVRVVCLSGVGVSNQEAADLDVTLCVRPAIASADAVRLNCGGSIVTPFAADAYHNGAGATSSTSQAIDITGVADPAPVAVYQSWRAKYYDSAPIVYTVGGLVRGLSYKVRLHFAECYWNNVNDQKFNISVTGSTVGSHANYDILAAAGAKRKAVVREWTLKPSANGSIEVRLQPMPGNSQYLNCSINGVEILPIA